jgi:hypothetical protein
VKSNRSTRGVGRDLVQSNLDRIGPATRVAAFLSPERDRILAGVQKLLFHLGRSRLGPISKKTRVAIESINDLTRLERLGERLLDVSSWAELLSEAE